jgi:hypothetical protein
MMSKRQKSFKPGQGYTREDWDAVCDNPEWTAEDFARAKPFAEVFPELAASIRKGRGPNKAPTKKLATRGFKTGRREVGRLKNPFGRG